MANKPLKSIQFPGLSDTYTVPQVDNTLAVAGDAADAKKTGDEIASVKEDLSAQDGKIAATMITNTASGAVASFPDGADGVPVRDLVIGIEPVQAGSGDPAPDNVRPISGWTGANVVRAGKNLYPYEYINKYTYTWYIGSTALADATKPFFLKGGVSYVLSYSPDEATYATAQLRVWRADGTLLSDEKSVLNAIMLNETSSFYKFSWQSTPKYYSAQRSSNINSILIQPTEDLWIDMTLQSGTGGGNEPMLVIGSTATEYEPYKGNTYPISWQTEAGTVYGGTLDVTTGVLTANKAFITIDGSLTPSGIDTNETRTAFRVSLSDCPYWDNIGSTSLTGAIANWATEVVQGAGHTPSSIAIANAFSLSGSYYSYRQIGISITPEVTTDTAIQEYMNAHPLTICYPMRIPVTYQLTPTEVKTLLGQNNIWADTGDSTVTYCADPTLYIAEETAPKVVTVTGSTPSITAVSETRYVCGEVTSISFTPASSGICSVRFTSGTTPAVLTLPNTVKLPEWFDATSLEASTVYEISIEDGVYGVVMTWDA